MPVVMPGSRWTKEAILRVAKAVATSNGYEWRSDLERMPKKWLTENLLVPTGGYAARGHMGRELVYTSHIAEYMLDERKLRHVLSCRFKPLVAKPKKTKKSGAKGLSKSAKRKWKRYGIVPPRYKEGSR